MALDIKKMIADSFLELCEKKPVSKITVKDISERTELSRKTFYNHFHDKNDLIQYCYEDRIVPAWKIEASDSELDAWNLEWLRNMRRYKKFMKSACLIDEPNSLKNYILNYRSIDIWWYQRLKKEPLTEELKLCIDYHGGGYRYMIIEWVLTDMKISEDVLCNLIKRSRRIVTEEFFKENDH